MSAYSDTVMADAPTAYWRLGESSGTSVADSSGNGNTGTLSSSMPPGAAASLLPADPANGAIQFDPAATTGPVRADTTLSVTTMPLTVEFWINLQFDGGPLGVPVGCGNDPTGWATYFDKSTHNWHWTNRGITDAGFSAVAVAGVTQHVVFVAASGDVSLYLDGVFQQTLSPGSPGAGANLVCIGQSSEHNYSTLGVIDEVAIFPAALSATRIAAHYAAAFVAGGAPARDTHTAIPFTRGAGGGGRI